MASSISSQLTGLFEPRGACLALFVSSRRRHTRFDCDWVQTCALPIWFPWLGLGTSLADAPILVQWADLAGTRGVTLWLAWCNVMIVEGLLQRREQGAGSSYIRWRPLVVVLGTVALAWVYGAWRERTLSVRTLGVVGLVQPNEGFREKWNKAREDSVMAQLFALSRQIADRTHVDLLIWPEADR